MCRASLKLQNVETRIVSKAFESTLQAWVKAGIPDREFAQFKDGQTTLYTLAPAEAAMVRAS